MAIDIKAQVITFKATKFPTFHWCYGKWFLGDEELDIDHYLLLNTPCNSLRQVEQWKSCYIALYGKSDLKQWGKKWADLEVVRIAQERLNRGIKAPTKLAFPFSEKELKLINYLLVGKAEYAIFFYGVGGSGKSTILNIIRALFNYGGMENVANRSICDISKFNMDLEGKRLWIDDDMAPRLTEAQVGKLKSIATNAEASFEPKGVDPHQGRYLCKVVCAGNSVLDFDISDTGMLRRVIYYMKNTKIANPDKSLIDKEYSEEELIGIAMAALSMDMTDWEQDFTSETHTVIKKSNSVWKYGMEKDYAYYRAVCWDKGCHPYGEEKWAAIKELFAEWAD